MIINKACFLCGTQDTITSIDERLLLMGHNPMVLLSLKNLGVKSTHQYICDHCWTEKILKSGI